MTFYKSDVPNCELIDIYFKNRKFDKVLI
ncbi:unnamed protein product [Spirodela intermedia]|uniref:Uncharacterized protein n=2 Tax=Spirodela intermedia TaxID=51605 RepID=A0A7I8IGZ1_SPIIN|nr:unnamed protein product [Spirodela intermedia]CAA6656122.1 unnamed protein product [Spirodela intermedia]CAA7391584.1 unnamed protein product [Spirodela intermedia]